jgi:hypothetical protein
MQARTKRERDARASEGKTGFKDSHSSFTFSRAGVHFQNPPGISMNTESLAPLQTSFVFLPYSSE